MAVAASALRRLAAWRLVLGATCAGVWPMHASAADASNADERTVVPSLSYDGDLGVVAHGGQSGQGDVYAGLLRLRLRWLLPTASAWRGTSAFLDVRNILGGHLSDPTAA